MPSVSCILMPSIKLINLSGLTEKALNLLIHQNVIIGVLMHWPIIVVHHLSRDLLMMIGLNALSERKFTISEQTNGMMPLIILITRKGVLILSNIEKQHIEL